MDPLMYKMGVPVSSASSLGFAKLPADPGGAKWPTMSRLLRAAISAARGDDDWARPVFWNVNLFPPALMVRNRLEPWDHICMEREARALPCRDASV